MIEDPTTAEFSPDDRASAPQGRPYLAMVKLVEDLFATHGDSHRGLGYSNENGFHDRYRAYLDVTRFGPPVQAPVRVLDIGCATGRLLDHIKASTRTDIVYRGVDLSATILDKARDKHPEADFVHGDPFDLDHIWAEQPDYVVMGGLFTSRLSMSEEQMTDYMLRMLRLAFSRCRVGIAFDVNSKHVDWERDDLFHVGFDRMAGMVRQHLGRNYVLRSDYGRYEYITYVYR